MPSPTEPGPPGGTDGGPSARAFALCLLVCASLQIIEGLLPRFPLFPWLKAGLSHIVLLPFLLRFGPGPAGALLLGRNLLTLLFAAGSLSTYLIGTASGLAAIWAGGALVRAAAGRGLLGMAGAGMAMAALMNAAQLAVVEGLFIRHAAFWFQLAPMLAWSAVSGSLVAWLALRARPALEELFEERGDAFAAPAPAGPAGDGAEPAARAAPGEGQPAAFLACLAALVALFLLPGPALPGAALLLLLLLSAVRGVLGEGLRNLARGWPWFLYLAWLHLLLGEGDFLTGVPGIPGVLGTWVTRQGAEAFLAHGARLAALILLGPHLAAAFPRRWLAGSRSAWARGTLAALPLLPGLHAAAIGSGRAFLRAVLAGRDGGDARDAGEGRAAGTPDGARTGNGVADMLRGLADGFRAALAGGAGGSPLSRRT